VSRERIRTLKPEFFRDEKIKLLSRDARLVAIGLISRADDRGRQANESQAILGHIFPGGDVNAKQLARWVGEIVGVGFSKLYAHGPFEYLWLPNFWKHQVINRPTESDYPPHPDDMFADMPITEAIKVYRTEVLTEKLTEFVREDLTPPRAGARSVPFLEEETTLQGTEEIHARVRELFTYWQERCGHAAAKLTSERRTKIQARLKDGYTPEQVREGIDGAARDPFVSDGGRRYDDIELICRNGSKLESFIARNTVGPVQPSGLQMIQGLAAREETP
jgi:hypothetical protein